MAGQRAFDAGTLISTVGKPVGNARGIVYVYDTTTPLPGVYTADTGGVAVTSVVTDARGHWELWHASPRLYTIEWTDNTGAAYYADSPGIPRSFGALSENREADVPTDAGAQTDEAQTWTAAQNFTGGLSKAGVAVATIADLPLIPNLVFDGDSQSLTGLELGTLSASASGTGYAAQTVSGIDPRATLVNVAVASQTVTQMAADAAAQIDPLYNATKRSVVLMWGGTNDLINAPTFVGPFPDAATMYARIVAYHQARRAVGWKTVVFTILPRTQAFNANYEADRLTVNASIRANWATFADAIADIGGDPIIGAAAQLTNTAYFSDGVHVLWGNGGARIVARYAKVALATLGVIAPSRPATDALFGDVVGSLTTGVGIYALRANTTGSSNAAFGYDAMRSNTTGSLNSAFGRDALYSNTTGGNNSAFGMQALRANTTGASNSAFGLNAMLANTTGSFNAAFGVDAMVANTTGASNSAFGYFALSANTTGTFNAAFGRDALFSNTTGADNTAVGYRALRTNSTGINNTAVGSAAMLANTTGDNNTAVGVSALQGNQTGLYNTAVGSQALLVSTASSNTAVGYAALQANTSGVNSAAVGRDALFSNTTGQDNTALGMNALRSNTTGGSNVAVGLNALYANTTASQNTAIGVNALFNPGGAGSPYATTTGLRQTAVGYGTGQGSATQRDDVVCVGYYALVDANDTVALGSGARALHANSVALGKGVVTTAANQVMVGPNDIEITATAKGLVIKSPDGTRYRIQVANGGALSTVAA